MTKALGMIETRGLATSIEAADVMLKDANVRLVNQSMVDAALVTIVIEGDVSSVQAAVDAGVKVAKRTGALIAYNVIPHPDQEIVPLFTQKQKKTMQKKEETITEKTAEIEAGTNADLKSLDGHTTE